MMEEILCFMSGLMIGGAIGYTIAAVMQVAARADREAEKREKE